MDGDGASKFAKDFLDKLAKKEKLISQLFIGKVADELGIEKTTKLLKEARDAIEGLVKQK